jgi:hypothetical protein
MAALRGTIDRADLARRGIAAQLDIAVRSGIIGNKLLKGRRMEVSTLSIRPKDSEPEFVELINAPAPGKNKLQLAR